MAIKFSTKDQPKTPPAKGGKPAPATDAAKTPAVPVEGDENDLFEAETAKPAAKGKRRR